MVDAFVQVKCNDINARARDLCSSRENFILFSSPWAKVVRGRQVKDCLIFIQSLILALAKKFLALGYEYINMSSNSVKTIDIATQYPPELLGRMLSGYPGRFSTNTSDLLLFSPLSSTVVLID